jgi:hypothetical protein
VRVAASASAFAGNVTLLFSYCGSEVNKASEGCLHECFRWVSVGGDGISFSGTLDRCLLSHCQDLVRHNPATYRLLKLLIMGDPGVDACFTF